MNKIFAKIRKTNGESIAETLVALLIAALGLLALAGAINSALNIVERTNRAMEKYVDGQKYVITRSASISGDNFTVDKTGSLKITIDELNKMNYTVVAYINNTLNKIDVVSFRIKVAGE